MGIDPGTHRVGWGVISGNSSKQTVVAQGCLEFPPGTPPTVYLPQIHSQLSKLITTHHPELLGLETLLFQTNVKTAISVAQARGVILLTAAQTHLPVIEIAPNTVKSAVAGTGSAGKLEVERMVRLLLGLGSAKLLDDTTDALAIALAALVTHKHI